MGVDNKEVITTPFTFIASSNAIIYAFGKPVFVDIEDKTCNIDLALMKERISQDTKVLMPVHLFGNPCDMDRINALKESREGLLILEDACQAHGATYQGRPAGSFATSAFSFYPTKNMTTGEGGIVTTNDDALAEKMRLQVDGVRVEVEGNRRDEPPGIVQIRYRLILDSQEPDDKLEKLHDLAFKWGTVTNTLLDGVAIQGELTRGLAL